MQRNTVDCRQLDLLDTQWLNYQRNGNQTRQEMRPTNSEVFALIPWEKQQKYLSFHGCQKGFQKSEE